MKSIISRLLFKSEGSIIIGLIVLSSFVFSLKFVSVARVFGYDAASSSSSTTASSDTNCSDAKPTSAPDLFQIDAVGTSAQLFFTPISNTNKYFVSFSTNANAEENGAEVTLAVEGVQNYTVYLLKPNTTYYFKIRGQNGCMAGDWSNIMKATSRGSFLSKMIFYKNYVARTIAGLFQPTSTVATTTTTTTTNEPNPVVAPKGTTNQPVATVAPRTEQQGVAPVKDAVPAEPQPKVGFWQSVLNFLGFK